jgi:trigger factor
VVVSKEIERLEKSRVKLSITVGKDDVSSGYNELLVNYTKSIQIPGFRKGKVPRDVLLRKFGEALKGEALANIIEKSIGEAFEGESRENRPLPYSSPALQEEPELDIEKDLKFSVVYDVLPEVKVGKWEGLEAEIPDVSITDDDVARELEQIRERNSIVLDKDDGDAAAEGDVVTVNYCELSPDSDEVAAGSEREDFTFTLGSGYNIYKFDDEIAGMKKGEQKTFTKSYPKEFEDETLADKTKKIKVTLTGLKVKKLPELNDDLAQDVDEKFTTLEDLKKNLHEKLDKDLKNRLHSIKLNKLLELIMENTPIEIPESMLRAELDARWRRLARNFETDSEGLYRIMGNSAERAGSLIRDWTPDAEKALHSRLIVETLIEELKLKAMDDEVEKEIEKRASESGNELEIFKKHFEDESMLNYLKEEIIERKFFDLLLEKNTIKAGQKDTYAALAGINRYSST